MEKSIFSKNLELIIQRLMTLEALAEISNVDKSTIHRIVKNSHKSPYKKTRQKIADALNFDLDYMDKALFTEKDIQNINFSPRVNYEITWSGNDKSVYEKYKVRKPVAQSFTLKVDKDHSSLVMPVGSVLEFVSEIAFEDDIVAYVLDEDKISIGKITCAKRDFYLIEDSIQGKNKLKHSQILGILKNIHL